MYGEQSPDGFLSGQAIVAPLEFHLAIVDIDEPRKMRSFQS
jgi:hypothetical protein